MLFSVCFFQILSEPRMDKYNAHPSCAFNQGINGPFLQNPKFAGCQTSPSSSMLMKNIMAEKHSLHLSGPDLSINGRYGTKIGTALKSSQRSSFFHKITLPNHPYMCVYLAFYGCYAFCLKVKVG